ncbi:MAG: PDZ domain-containing protein [Bacteroidota bacterium]
MKTFQRYTLLSFVLLLFVGTSLHAQRDSEKTNNSTFLIIQKNNGQEKVVKNFDDLDNVLLDFNVEGEDADRAKAFMYNRLHDHAKPFLGVYSSKNSNGNGIILDGIVSSSAAEKAGLQKGDIITFIDGNAINSVSDLRAELKQHEVGDAINIQYVRNGQATQVSVELGKKKTRTRRVYRYDYKYDYKVERDPCKVFIGVYSGTSYSSKGVRVTGVIEDTPAYEVDLLKGDYITAIDGIEVRSHRELLTERNKHNPGDRFVITFTRDGIEYDVTAQFKDCPTEEAEVEMPVVEESIVEEVPEIIESPIQSPTNGILQLEGLEAFPNPTYGDLNLRFQSEAKPITVRIVDVQGRVIYSENLNNFDGDYNQKLDLSKGTPGVMAVTIMQEGKVFTKNIVLLARA